MTIKYISPENIEKIAEKIRADFLTLQKENDFNEVDIYQIAKGLGCTIQIVDFEPSNISARVLRENVADGDYIIQISREDSSKRQKFSIAHEIAHIILHEDNKNEFIALRQKNAVDYEPEELYKEVQANMLASALLLPNDQVRRIWENSKSIDEVAEIFNVSKEAAYNRLDNLGLLTNE